MKNIIYLIVCLASLSITAQDQKNNDGILLGTYIPRQAERIPATASRMLVNKLGQVITSNGISDNLRNARFVLVPNVTVLSKDITPTAPPKTALNLEVTLYIGDGKAGILYESYTFQLKGVGTNETKAYVSAIKQLKPKNAGIQDFVNRGKEKIVAYYDKNCGLMIKKAEQFKAQDKLEDAMTTLLSVPEVSSCFSKVKPKIAPIFQKIIDKECKQKLSEATGVWSANQDVDGANHAGSILATIHPKSSCFTQVKSLHGKIETKMKQNSDRVWEYQLKELELEKSSIEAARDVWTAYAKNQPDNTTYNTSRWYK